jgi:predicted acyl esterase
MARARLTRPALIGTLVVVVTAALMPAASPAAVPSVYDGDVACAAQPASGGVRLCDGPTTTWDGQTKIDVNVILPPEPVGVDGPYPAIGVFHGWGGSKIGLDATTQGWAEEGYVVFSMSDRGWGNSCGSADPDRLPLSAKCAEGYNHLMDTRYEVRDAQHLLAVLADEGVVQPDRIGATGVSYGGGLSMALAALRDRTMLPDGSLVPWTSPLGTPMEIAAAVPQWPWTDLAYSLMPNGATLDYVADAPYLGPDGTAPIGVMKASYVSALYTLGQGLSNYAPPGTDPDADLVTWYGLVTAGEPYDGNPLAQDIVEEITTHHSSYYLDHSQPPAPLLIQSGWNDDLFPVDEAIRFYNRTRSEHPGDPISLYLMDDGHMRSQSKPADLAAFAARRDAWFDHYLKGLGPAPQPSVEALTTSCAKPSEGPYAAPTWRALAPGEIRLQSAAAKTVLPAAGDPSIGLAFDPVPAGNACATASGADQPGAASYRLGPAPGSGFTLIGSPTVIADVATLGATSQLAARLLDVAPGGTETLVARGLLRPGSGTKRMVFQLHPQAYRFAPGHVAKLELLPADAPYSRPSNGQLPISVANLELRLPVLEAPGSLGGLVRAPAPKVVPPGYRLARDYEASGGTASGGLTAGPTPRRGTARLLRGPVRLTAESAVVRLRCAGSEACAGRLAVLLGRRALARGPFALAPGRTGRARVPLTGSGQAFRQRRRRSSARRTFPVRVEIVGSEAPALLPRALRLG